MDLKEKIDQTEPSKLKLLVHQMHKKLVMRINFIEDELKPERNLTKYEEFSLEAMKEDLNYIEQTIKTK